MDIPQIKQVIMNYILKNSYLFNEVHINICNICQLCNIIVQWFLRKKFIGTFSHELFLNYNLFKKKKKKTITGI